jgi:hypothetical protein
MIAIFLIALAAGSASALMFASIVSGALISLVLFYLAPLPLMVAALGWGPLSAASGGIAASIGLGAIFGIPLCIAFAVAVALPAWWLGHLVLLGRPVSAGVSSNNGSLPVTPNLEWYPVGRIVLWTSGFAALITIAALLSLGLDAATIRSTLRQGLLGIVKIVRAHDAVSTGESERVVDILVSMAPVAAAIVTTTTLTLNLWLAAKITAISGRLHRPWPVLRTVALPSTSFVTFCIAFAFCFAGGLLGIAAQVVAATLMLAYALTGFAVLHTLTAALKTRAIWLSCTYCLVFVFVWPVVVMAVVGLADAVFGIRQRFLNSRPPPMPAS